jgi:Winged helix-turn-helix domain (DUF2582)
MVKSEIGVNAGIIWQYLDSKGECSTDALKEQLEMNDAEFNMALGWLAREDKIVFYEKNGLQVVFLYF